MTLIRKISGSMVTAASQEPQPEAAPQPKPQTSLGVGSTPDRFETASTNRSYFQDQSAQSVAQNQLTANKNLTVDPSSAFRFFEPSVSQLDNRLPQLNDQLKSLEEKRRELTSKIENERKEIIEAQEAVNTVKEALKSDKPIPDAILPLLGSLGVLGMIGGLPAIPILGGLGIFAGMSGEYKEKAMQANAELERKIAEKEANAEEYKSELGKVDSKIQSVQGSIEREKMRLEREARPAQDRMMGKVIVQEPIWEEFLPDQNLIQTENSRVLFNVDPMIQKKVDE